MESHIYTYSVVKMASRLDVSIHSYYDYRNGIYRKRSLQRVINDLIEKAYQREREDI